MEETNHSTADLPPSFATNLVGHGPLDETKESPWPIDTNHPSTPHAGLDIANTKPETDLQNQQAAQDSESIKYPGGIQLFLLASVTHSPLLFWLSKLFQIKEN